MYITTNELFAEHLSSSELLQLETATLYKEIFPIEQRAPDFNVLCCKISIKEKKYYKSD